MRRFVIALGVAVLSGCGSPARPLMNLAPVEVPEADAAAVISSANRFGLDLYSRIREKDGNRFLSPICVWTALTMTHAGARGETAAQMGQTLHLTLSPDRLHLAVHDHLYRLTHGGDGYELSIAGAVWSTPERPAGAEFAGILRDHYGAESATVDFAGNPEAARKQINGWVADSTANRIKELFAPGTIDSLTRFVLTNAVYFLGSWKEEFDEDDTKTEPFHLADGNEQPVRLMNQKGDFLYGEVDGTKLLEMRYEDSPLALLAILPATPDGLPAVEAKLTEETLKTWTAEMHEDEVTVWFPRFEFDAGLGLADTLGAMGMPLAFSDEADFSGIDGKGDLFIQGVVHKAYIRVDEEGTEAAAATGVYMGVTAQVHADPKTFRADRPFLFLIRNRETGAILFMGRLVEPT